MAKLYVIPVESACNARCPYCVNQFRDLGNSFLSLGNLEKCLKDIGTIDAIEISGGGEPTLHPKISSIIELCSRKTRTQMYTNGQLIGSIPNSVLKKLDPLCISRSHYDSVINEKIMGIKGDDAIFYKGLNIKISAVLFKGGIESPEDAEKYIAWAKGRANKIVFRPLFQDVNYTLDVKNKVVSLELFSRYFGFDANSAENFKTNLNGVEVEFETRSCSCENSNPILHANGKVNYSWRGNDINRSGN